MSSEPNPSSALSNRLRRAAKMLYENAAGMATANAAAVAIPAVFGYNILAHRLNRFDGELDVFGSELIALMVREGRI